MMIRAIEINEELRVCVVTGVDPHVLIDRVAGGLVRIEAREVRHLADVLTLAGGDLAALAALGKVVD